MDPDDHTLWDVEEPNKMDPDDGNSTLCEACRLPIFSTHPFITTPYDQNNQVLHDGCGNDHLPPKLEGRHPLHPKKDLILQHQHQTINNNNNKNCCCSRCGSMCGTSYYECADIDDDCCFRLDLACALTINWIVHMSHPHKLTAIKSKSLSSLLCAVCGTRHPEASTWQVWYVCIPCDFWVHPDCALLPNAIQIEDEHHSHPLLLNYLMNKRTTRPHCGICRQPGGNSESAGWGRFVCFHCMYMVHIKCIVYSDPDHPIHFEPVKVRDAQVPGLLHLPMPNETTSVMAHISTKIDAIKLYGTSSTSSSIMSNEQIHEHPLILHDDPTVAAAARICNACVHLISPSDPFYSCCNNNNNNNNDDEIVVAAAEGGCSDFFLHMCCAHLPTEITTMHTCHVGLCSKRTLTLVSKTDFPFNMFKCRGCKRKCNGFAYTCEGCNFYLDVVCAFLQTSITHDVHAKSHILLSSNFWDTVTCICCAQSIDSWSDIGYKCNSCRNFGIHGKCTLLPDTITHKFDRHPLKLISTDHHLPIRDGSEQIFCEICENDIDDTRTWYYGCKVCNQYFHTGCIPCVDRLSKIKFGFSVRVSCHNCPLVAVRALSVEGYLCQCGRCERIITESDKIAFECSQCYFRIRKACAKKLNN